MTGKREVPRDYVAPDGFKLGTWQHTQRMAFRSGKLTRDRRRRLEAAGMVLDPPPVRGAAARADGSAHHHQNDGVARVHEREREYHHKHHRRGGSSCDWRRRLRDSPPPVTEAAWHEEWRERLGCWWLALPRPTQTSLGQCLGALSLHLGSRLELALGDGTPRLTPHQTSQQASGGADAGGGWGGGRCGSSVIPTLELPLFPTMDGFQFSLPPIPRLLPQLLPQGTLMGSLPLGSLPLGTLPLGSVPLSSVPLGSVPPGLGPQAVSEAEEMRRTGGVLTGISVGPVSVGLTFTFACGLLVGLLVALCNLCRIRKSLYWLFPCR